VWGELALPLICDAYVAGWANTAVCRPVGSRVATLGDGLCGSALLAGEDLMSPEKCCGTLMVLRHTDGTEAH
jgi:hypothetical protein